MVEQPLTVSDSSIPNYARSFRIASFLQVGALPAFALLLALACLVFWRIFEIRPLDGDNLYILAWADRAPASTLIRADPATYPEWRPLAYVTLWLQYRWSNIDPTAYFVVNLLLWTTCAWLIYRIVVLLVHSKEAGFLAAVLVLTDNRSINALVWMVDRQSSMACLFGLLALYWVFVRGDRRLGLLGQAGVLVLLLGSALSKEYGLAFAAALATHALYVRRADVAGPAVAAGVAYAGLRLGFVAGALGSYCERMGYFRTYRMICYERLDSALPQMLYNVGATAVGSLLNGLFNAIGQIRVVPDHLVASVIWLPVAVLGWLKGPRSGRMTALMIGFNALLSVMLYRSRNQLVAVCASAIAIGAGWALLDDALTRHPRRWLRPAAVALVFLLVAVQTVHTRIAVSIAVHNLLAGDPCIKPDKRVAPEFIRRVKISYGMGNPDCSAQP